MILRHWIAVALLALAPLVCYWEVLSGDVLLPMDWVYRDLEPWKRVAPTLPDSAENAPIWNSRIKDAFVDSYALDLVSARAARRGDVLLWNRHAAGGIPHLAAGFSRMFYPPFWIYAVLEPATARNVEILLHLFLAELFAFLFLVRLTHDPVGSIPGALLFGFTPSLLHRAELSFILPTLIWFPLLLLCIEEIITTERRRGILGLALAMFCQMTAGHYPDILLNVIGASTYGVARLVVDGRSLARCVRPALLCLAGVGIGVAGSAPFLFPSIELLPRVHRAIQSSDFLAGTGLGWHALLTLFTPWLSRSQMYIGWTALVFVPAAFLSWRGRHLRALAACLAVGVALGAGTPLLDGLLIVLPPVARLRYVHTMIALASYALALIAGLGIANLLHSKVNGVARTRAVSWSCALACGLLATVWVTELAGLSTLGSTLLRLPGLLGVMITLFLLLELLRRRLVGPKVFVCGLSLLIAMELFSYARLYNPRVSPETFPPFPEFGAIQFLRADPEPFRVASLLGNYDTPFWPNTLGAYGIDDIGAYHSLIPAELGTYMERIRLYGGGASRSETLEIEESSGNWLMPTGFRPSHLLSLWNVKYVLLPQGSENPDPQFLERVYDKEIQIYRYGAGLPRAWLTNTARVLPSRGVTSMMLDSFFNPRTTVLLEQFPEPRPITDFPTNLGSRSTTGRAKTNVVEVLFVDHENLRLRVQAQLPGYLVLSENYDAGWRASIDGRDVPVLRANMIFRAIAVDAGVHDVRLHYLPESYVRGWWSLGLSLLLATCLAIRYRVGGSSWQTAAWCGLAWAPMSLMPLPSVASDAGDSTQRAVVSRFLTDRDPSVVSKANGVLHAVSLQPGRSQQWTLPNGRGGNIRLRVAGEPSSMLRVVATLSGNGEDRILAELQAPRRSRRWGLYEVPIPSGVKMVSFTHEAANVAGRTGELWLGSPVWIQEQPRENSTVHVVEDANIPSELTFELRDSTGLKIFLGDELPIEQGSQEPVPAMSRATAPFDEAYVSAERFDSRLRALLPTLFEIHTDLVVVPPAGDTEAMLTRLTNRLETLGMSAFVDVRRY